MPTASVLNSSSAELRSRGEEDNDGIVERRGCMVAVADDGDTSGLVCRRGILCSWKKHGLDDKKLDLLNPLVKNMIISPLVTMDRHPWLRVGYPFVSQHVLKHTPSCLQCLHELSAQQKKYRYYMYVIVN